MKFSEGIESKFPHPVLMRENKDQKNTEYGHFLNVVCDKKSLPLVHFHKVYWLGNSCQPINDNTLQINGIVYIFLYDGNINH